VLKPLKAVTGWGPSEDVISLAEWAAWRWAGRRSHFLGTASPEGAVKGLPSVPPAVVPVGVRDDLAEEALAHERSVLRLPPAADWYPVVLAAAARGTTLVVAPSHADAAFLAARLRRSGVSVALLPREWAVAAAAARVVIGARSAAFAPAVDLAAVVVLDEHAEAHTEEGAPTWSARDVAVERARRAGVPCVLVSPVPSLEALGWGSLVRPSRSAERAGWPVVDVVDRSREDPRTASDLYSSRLVELVRSGRRVVCVLNRKGRARLLVCASCAELARCEACGAAVSQDDDRLACGSCGTERPPVCLACGAGRFKARRLGVTRAREDLERLAGVPVAEVTGESGPLPDVPVLVGTEAVLHRAERADAVAFLDLDGELLAPRYRAAEDTLGLLARAARLVGGRDGGGRLLLQTRLPQHEAVQAALHADASRFTDAEVAKRAELAFPPFAAIAEVKGVNADQFVAPLRGRIEVLGPSDAAYLLRAPDHRTICDALASVTRPPGRLRVAVDPRRI
jgi:primosomal protein N' (replication factor Y)